MGSSNSKGSYSLDNPNVVDNSVGTYSPPDNKENTQRNQSAENPASSHDMFSQEVDKIESEICAVKDLQDGILQEFELEGGKIVVVKDNNKIFAFGHKCSHYGAPLAKGAYSNGIVRCPWHGACFHVDNGDIEDFPGLDSIASFTTKVVNGRVKVTASKKLLAEGRRRKPMCRADPNFQNGPVVIVGGGGSALSCAESLRQNDYKGPITIITKETDAPYDRPKLSKALDIDVETILLRKPDFYEECDIRLMKGTNVVGINSAEKVVQLSDKTTLKYQTLVLATGGRPRELTCPGADLKNVFYLRTPEDGKRIASASAGRNVVVIGSSFIGTGVTELQGENGTVKKVVLQDGTSVPADVVIVGIGVVPSTDFVKFSGLEMTDRGFIKVDDCMKTSLPDVYACGDIVVFPLSSFDNQVVNVQHWQMALKHGKTAGHAISGKHKPIKTVPFFWTVLFGKSLRYTGYSAGFDDTVIHGDVEELKFVAYFMKQNVVCAVATLNRDPVAAQFAELFRNGIPVHTKDVELHPDDNWQDFLAKV